MKTFSSKKEALEFLIKHKLGHLFDDLVKQTCIKVEELGGILLILEIEEE